MTVLPPEIRRAPSVTYADFAKLARCRGWTKDKTVKVNIDMGGARAPSFRPGQISFTNADLGLPAGSAGSAAPTLSPTIEDIRAAFGDVAAENFPITFVPEVKFNPTVPFSQFFRSDAPNLIEDFVSRAQGQALTFDSNFSSAIVGTLNEIINAKEQLAVAIADKPFRASIIGDFSVGPRARLQALEETLAFLRKTGQPSSPSTGGGGGGIIVNVNNDFTNSVVTSDALAAAQRDMLPATERSIRMATGKGPAFRVLS